LEAALESLHEIEDLISDFPEKGKIPSIEIDLTLQKLRNLYELLLMMKTGDNHSNVINEEPRKADPSIKVIEESVSTKVTMTSSVEEVKTIREEEKTKEDKTLKENEKAENSSGINTTKIEKKSKRSSLEVQTLADQFKGGPTLLESLSQSYNKDSETFAHSRPISDLMGAIALNDRFTFIRELFNNDKKAFEAAITELNAAGSYSAAYKFMEENFQLNMDHEAVQMLLSIVRRKY
jgi:HD-GYP domain-containing protein (c-di-GMP phosphodiesterase class II)